MNPEAQRIAIAEACGWSAIHAVGKDIFGTREEGVLTFIPNYLSDLNAMRDAWLTLTKRQQDAFAGFMGDITGGAQRDFGAGRINMTTAVFGASPTQWGEAFLKTIGKWED